MAKRRRGKRSGNGNDLSAILTPTEMADFSIARRNQKPFLATGNKDRFLDYFSISGLEGLLNQTGIWTPDRLEVYLDTKKVPPQNFFSQLKLYNGLRFRLEPEKLQRILRSGASIVLNDIDTLSQGLKTLKGVLTDFSSGKVESNLYYSQPGHQAFPIHFDVHEVFAYQIAGRKRWRVYQQAHRFPIKHLSFLSSDTAAHEKAKGAVAMDFVLRQGDIIYLPAGYYHQAICTDSVSVHLSFSVIEMIGLDIVSELFDRGVLDEFFRTPVNRLGDDDQSPDERMDSYLKMLASNIEHLLTDKNFVDALKQKLREFQHPSGDVTIQK